MTNRQLIDKHDYLDATEISPIDATRIKELISGALTDRIDDREIFIKCIDYSYCYEEIEDEDNRLVGKES